MISIIKGRAVPIKESRVVDVRAINLDMIHASRSGGRSGPELAEDHEARARLEAKAIVREAEAQAESIRQHAYDEGLQARAEDSAQALEELVHHLESEIAEVVARRHALVDEIEPEVLKLCLEAVEKISRHEIRTDRRVVERTIKACLRRVRDRAEVTIRVSPHELDHVRSVRDDLLAAADGIKSAEIVEDRRVGPGGCVVETDSGSLDARIETQLDTLRDKIMETLEDDRGGDNSEPDEV